MSNQTDHSSKNCLIIGMDFFTPDCPSLDSFKTFLLIRDKRSSDNHLLSEATESLSTIVNESAKDLSNYEQVIKDVLDNTLRDAGLDTPLKEKSAIPVMIHLPSTINFSGLKGSLKDFHVVQGKFYNALEQVITNLHKNNSEVTAFISLFAYSSPAGNKQDKNSDSLNRKGNSIGLACLLLTKENQPMNAYANLICKKLNDDQLHDKNASKTLYPDFQSAPISRLVRSALELNCQTYFADHSHNHKTDSGENDDAKNFLHPWFPQLYADKREVVVQIWDKNESKIEIQVEKSYNLGQHSDNPFMNFQDYLLPISFTDPQHALKRIEEIKLNIRSCEDIPKFVECTLEEFKNERKPIKYTLVILGTSQENLIEELEHASSGIIRAFENGRDWQTPQGSYFTPNPIGPKEKIAFVYPGAFGTYVGMGREIFYLFPRLYETLSSITSDPSSAINEAIIFPSALSPQQNETLQNKLNQNPIQMISSGVCFSYLFTTILRDIFKVKPDSAFGYSLGENSMMFAMGIWTQADSMRTSLEVSPIFHTRVSGSQNAIREYWHLPADDGSNNGTSLWANYVLMAPYEKVKEAIKEVDHVYITHVNTPRQVVIGGEKDACKQVANSIKCMHLQAPYHHAIHCAPVTSEFDGFVHLHDWPVENTPRIPIYTAAEYAPLEYDSKSIANSFATMLTNPIDFPRLVNLAYDEGARIFIELGAGSNCSKWVEAILKGRPHTAMTINQNNVSDHLSILRLIGRLISHLVPVDLSPLQSGEKGVTVE